MLWRSGRMRFPGNPPHNEGRVVWGTQCICRYHHAARRLLPRFWFLPRAFDVRFARGPPRIGVTLLRRLFADFERELRCVAPKRERDDFEVEVCERREFKRAFCEREDVF